MYHSLSAYYVPGKSLNVLYKHHHNQNNSYYCLLRASNSHCAKFVILRIQEFSSLVGLIMMRKEWLREVEGIAQGHR